MFRLPWDRLPHTFCHQKITSLQPTKHLCLCLSSTSSTIRCLFFPSLSPFVFRLVGLFFQCILKYWCERKYFVLYFKNNHVVEKFFNYYCLLIVHVVYICLQAGVALSRIGKFLRSSELDPDNKSSNPSEGLLLSYFTPPQLVARELNSFAVCF